MGDLDGRATAARAWCHARQEAPCDVVEAWEHGTILRADRHPDFYFHNAVRIEDDAALDADELIAFADQALGRTCHMVSVDRLGAARALRPRMEALGWRMTRTMLMLHDGPVPHARAGGPTIAEVAYDDVHELRAGWEREEFPDSDPSGYLASKREIDLAGDVRVLAALAGGAPIGFADLARTRAGAEIAGVYVAPEHRGRGAGTALTRASVECCERRRALWIGADPDERPRRIYERLGFRPAWTYVEFLLMPRSSAEPGDMPTG